MTFIRVATATDLEFLQEIEDDVDTIFATVFSMAGWRPAPAYTGLVDGFILVASSGANSEPVGFAHVMSNGHLEQLSVRQSAARSGHGRALVDAVKAECSSRGYSRITLRTFAEVPWNGPFYGSCGFLESSPDTEFLRGLVTVEEQLGLTHGRRIQMSFELGAGSFL